VVFALVSDVVYTAVDGKPKTTTALQRLANIEASGRASLLVDRYDEDWSLLWWVRVDSSAQVLAMEGAAITPDLTPGSSAQISLAVEALARKYPQYASQPPTGPVIAMQLQRWRSWEATPTP
jgi:PPOX class probable F420-dependent enzyme